MRQLIIFFLLILCKKKCRITIGDKAWIAGDVKILAGVTIGEGAVIGCGSVVTHDIPPRTVAAGNPCRVIREITEADKVGFVK